MSKVYIFFADGFEDIEGLTVVDLMRRAGIDIQTVSVKETKEIRTSHGINILTDRTFGECDFSDADMLVIPGGMPGTKYLEEYKPLTDLLTDFYRKGGKIAAICAAPGVFERLGFLKGRNATSYPSVMEQLTSANTSLEAVVVDGNVTTSRGLGTAIDFSLSLIRQLEEAGIADDTVIVISPDHYPYGLERSATWKNAKNYLKELYGVTEMNRFSRDNNALIIWSGCLEDKNLKVETPVYSLDILPTLSNLFGLDYDSRLLVGRDVFSDAEPLVLWPEFSWKTDKGTYDAETKTFTPAEGVTVEEGYVERIKNTVSNKINFCKKVQDQLYFNTLSKLMNNE